MRVRNSVMTSLAARSTSTPESPNLIIMSWGPPRPDDGLVRYDQKPPNQILEDIWELRVHQRDFLGS